MSDVPMRDKGFVVLVEGCDKCGKSTLTAQLSVLLKAPVVKFGQPGPLGAFREYMQALEEVNEPFIADRFHLGESVYGPIYRGAALNHFEVRSIENALLERGALLVLMEDEAELIAKRFAEHKEEFAKVEDIEKILAAFDTQFRRSRIPKLRATLNNDLSKVIYHAARNMQWLERRRKK